MPQLTRAQMQTIADEKSRAMQRALLSTWSSIVSGVVLSELVGFIEAGNIDAAIAAINIDRTRFASFEAAIIDSYAVGGAATELILDRVIDPVTGASFAPKFNARNPRAENWITQKSSTLIQQNLVIEQISVVREYLRAGLQAGDNPRRTALDLVGRINKTTGTREGGIIGLSEPQKTYVLNMRDELSNPKTMGSYFSRTRRDKRFDSIVKRAMDEGKPLSRAQIDKLSSRYGDRLLKLRGDAIARSESITALRAGHHEGLKQLTERSGIAANELERTWDARQDGRQRPDHDKIEQQAKENPVGLDEPFTAPDGSRLMYPGDTSLGASVKQTIFCRCSVHTRFKYQGRAISARGF